MNHYELFGISRDAADDEIKNAYKSMAKKYHPDIFEGSVEFAHEKMQQINAAYNVLSNDALREEYDYSLWLEDRANSDVNYANEFQGYAPRDSRINPEVNPSAWEKFYKSGKKPGRFFKFKPKSARARKIMALIWALRILIPVTLFFVISGLILQTAYMANVLDRIYGRGTPAEVTGMFFERIKEGEFERAMSLTRTSQHAPSNVMSRLVSAAWEIHNFTHDDLPLGEILFKFISQELSFKVFNTERFGFDAANVTVEVTNLNAARIYDEYTNEIIYEIQDEYLSVTVVLRFVRPFSNWIIAGADDIEGLRNVILGGFGGRSPDDYITIDWFDLLNIT